MSRVELSQEAPDFELPDVDGELVRLSNFHAHKHVILVFNRGFK